MNPDSLSRYIVEFKTVPKNITFVKIDEKQLPKNLDIAFDATTNKEIKKEDVIKSDFEMVMEATCLYI